MPRALWGFLAILVVGFFLAHLDWENHDGLSFPDQHSANFMVNAFTCSRFFAQLRGLATHEGPQGPIVPPNTQDYPPLSFLLSGFFMDLFGTDFQVARLAQFPFVAGLIVAMGRIGWQVAGWRGAVLLSLGVTTSVWLSQFVRVFSMAPGQMFIGALCLTLLLDSRGLTRPRPCMGIGLAFGLGMLVKYSVLVLALPALLVVAAPALFRSRRSLLGLVLVVLQVLAVVQLTRWGLLHVQVSGGSGFWPPLVLAANQLFLLGLLAALVLGRSGEPTSGVGLLLVSSACGLVCGTWYFSNMELWEPLIELQYSAAPFFGLETRWAQGEVDLRLRALWVTGSFYWGGLVWLALGTAMLATWREKTRGRVAFLVASLAVVLAHDKLLPPDVRYLATTLPLLVPLAFLWAARWQVTFVAVVAFMLLAGAFQVTGWKPSVHGMAGAAGLHLFPLSEEFIGPSDHPEPPRFLSDLTLVPIAESPSLQSDLLDIVPEWARTEIAWVDEPPDGSRFLRSFIRERERAYRYGQGRDRRVRSPDFLVLCAWRPIPSSLAARLGLLERVVMHQVRIFDRVLRVEVYRCPPGFDPEVLKRLGSMSGEA